MSTEESWEIENTTRDVLILPVVEVQGKEKVHIVRERLVLGDAADRIEHVQGAREEHLQPNPVRQITSGLVSKLAASGRTVLAHHIRTGGTRVTRGDQGKLLAALEA